MLWTKQVSIVIISLNKLLLFILQKAGTRPTKFTVCCLNLVRIKSYAKKFVQAQFPLTLQSYVIPLSIQFQSRLIFWPATAILPYGSRVFWCHGFWWYSSSEYIAQQQIIADHLIIIDYNITVKKWQKCWHASVMMSYPYSLWSYSYWGIIFHRCEFLIYALYFTCLFCNFNFPFLCAFTVT